jgi:hypothetical protein
MATCTAPGHPSCTITCTNGCGAIYYEPSGPCRTWCSRHADKDAPKDAPFEFKQGDKFSIQISELPANALAGMLGAALSADLAKQAQGSNKSISLSLSSASLEDLLKALRGQV